MRHSALNRFKRVTYGNLDESPNWYVMCSAKGGGWSFFAYSRCDGGGA
jgi:hypothetical protein